MSIEQLKPVNKRRQFIKKAGAGVAVSSLPMKSVWGACSVSGVMSGNLSQTGDDIGGTCGDVIMPNGGRSPGFWFTGEAGIMGSNGDPIADVFPQILVGIGSHSDCLVDTRIEAMRTIVQQFYSTETLTLPLEAAKYIYNSDTYYKLTPTLLEALNGTDAPSNRKSILKHMAVVYLNVYFALYDGVISPLNSAASLEVALIMMAKLIEYKMADINFPESNFGYTDGQSGIFQTTFEDAFSSVFDEECPDT